MGHTCPAPHGLSQDSLDRGRILSSGCSESQGEREARFEHLYIRYWLAVLHYGLRRGASRADAQDVVVETFLVCWRRLDEVSDPALAWLLGVARRVMANERRRERRQGRVASRLIEAQMAADHHWDDSQSERQDVGHLFGALARLKENERELLLLVAWDGLTHEEAAQVLGCSRSAFTKRFVRARARLEAQIGSNWTRTQPRATSRRDLT